MLRPLSFCGTLSRDLGLRCEGRPMQHVLRQSLQRTVPCRCAPRLRISSPLRRFVDVLAADWFLDSHCFAVTASGSGNADSLRVHVEPRSRSNRVEVAGDLVVSSSSLVLRRISWRYRNLPGGVPADAAGGEITFHELGDGAWLPEGRGPATRSVLDPSISSPAGGPSARP